MPWLPSFDQNGAAISSPPSWSTPRRDGGKQLMAWIRAVDYATAERALRRKRREILDADFATAPSFAEMLQDEEFYSSQPAPARGRPHAVATIKKR
jgi:hypothetical protein